MTDAIPSSARRDAIFRRVLEYLPILLAGLVCLADTLPAAVPATPNPVPAANQAQRVGTPGISLASLVVALGGHGSLVAVTPEVRANPWLNRVAPASAGLATPFTRPAGANLEALLAARPDLVVLWGDDTPLGRRLAQVGIPVLGLSYTTPEALIAAALRLGRALGPAESARAEAFAAYYRGNLARVAAGLAGLPEAAKPRVYYASVLPLYTEGAESMVNAWIEAAGGVNVAAQAGLHGDGMVHLEDLLAWNPDVIVTLDAVQRQAILADPRWRRIKAVRDGRVLVNPKGINAWCTRAAEAALQVLWAAKVFHPERFADLDLDRETRRFYAEFYGYALTDDELARVLQGRPPRP